MKRILLILFGLITLTITGVGIYTMSSKNLSSQPSTLQKEESMIKDDAMESKADSTIEDKMMKDDSSQRYVVYSKSALEAQSAYRRILYFYANWCPICKPADQDFKTNQDKIPEDVAVIRVNYNDSDTDQEEKDLAKKYAVTYQHTFVQIDKDGNEVTKWNGGKIEELLKNII